MTKTDDAVTKDLEDKFKEVINFNESQLQQISEEHYNYFEKQMELFEGLVTNKKYFLKSSVSLL